MGVAADHAAEVSRAILDSLLGLLREPPVPKRWLFSGEVRPSKSPVFASCHMLPTTLREKTVIGARNEPRSVLKLHAIGRVDASPVVEHRCLDKPTIRSDDDRSVDFISDT